MSARRVTMSFNPDVPEEAAFLRIFDGWGPRRNAKLRDLVMSQVGGRGEPQPKRRAGKAEKTGKGATR